MPDAAIERLREGSEALGGRANVAARAALLRTREGAPMRGDKGPFLTFSPRGAAFGVREA